MNNITTAIVFIIIVFLIGAVTSEIKIKEEQKGEQPICTTTRLTNSSFVVCTYKNKILYSGEVKDEN